MAEIRCVEKRETTKKRRKILQKNKFKKDEREKFERGRERGRGKERGINHKSIRVEVTHSTTLLLARASLSLSLSLSVFGFAGARSTKRDDQGALSQKKKEEYYRRCCDEKSVVVKKTTETCPAPAHASVPSHGRWRARARTNETDGRTSQARHGCMVWAAGRSSGKARTRFRS